MAFSAFLSHYILKISYMPCRMLKLITVKSHTNTMYVSVCVCFGNGMNAGDRGICVQVAQVSDRL